jgi:Rrf2 family iron-sulfur cluster assembly transcriptional regulator
MPLLARKGILAIAAVIDVAIHRGRPLSAKVLAARHGLPARHFEPLLQALVRRGILKGIRGPHGGYRLARERSRISVDQIVEAAGTVEDVGGISCTHSQLLNTVVMPALSQAEHAFSAALARITVEDLTRRAQSVIKSSGSIGTLRELQALSNAGAEPSRRISLLAPLVKREAEEKWGQWPSRKTSDSNR